jgi:anti-sigma regulatory factor (Ser/Thr protein kinase)
MNQRSEKLRLQLPTAPQSAVVARHACAAMAKSLHLSGQTVDAIRIAVGEAVGDAVRRHPREDGLIEIVAVHRADELELSVADGAIDLDADELARRLIDDATESYSVRERSGGGVELELRFPAGTRVTGSRRTGAQ